MTVVYAYIFLLRKRKIQQRQRHKVKSHILGFIHSCNIIKNPIKDITIASLLQEEIHLKIMKDTFSVAYILLGSERQFAISQC